ncbi:DUF342 domain-containing protein [Glaciecola sp. MH2013]|nr:DUF342 domain-containing protein [Glaciecola sp. MH2013]
MKGVTLLANKGAKQLSATVDPLLFEGVLEPAALEKYVLSTEHKSFFMLPNAIAALCEKANKAKSSDSMEEQTAVIGEVRDAAISVSIADDQMSAELTIESPWAGKVPSYEGVLALVNQQGVVRGISKKRIISLINEAEQGSSGSEFKDVIAKGLVPRNGKDSYLKPLVPNALERILQPQDAGDNKVDMRNLGDILCVPAKTPVARRQNPGNGRDGFTVTGAPLSPDPGQWKDIKLGVNTIISPNDENLIIASVTGQPKFENDVMNVDDTFQTKGVNVGTGNINYDGAVLVNGDVTESMQIIAKGDVTINGFVESAVIRAGGDIIITEGAMGKMNEEDCQLIAKGSVFVQHGQGLNIVAGKSLNVRRQLAYSRVRCNGKVVIGDIDKPNGNLFASEIHCSSTLIAGTVGAVSGSSLTIDFSEGINLLNNRYDALLSALKQLRENNFDHEVKLRELHSQHIPNAMFNQLEKIDSAFESEKHLLNWLENIEDDMRKARDDYEKNAKVIANKELFHGVSVKMNKRNWRSEKEYKKSVIELKDGRWQYTPLV